MLKLPEAWKAEIASIIHHYAPEFEVWAYGSRVTERHHEASDLDVVLIHATLPDTTRCNTLFQLREALRESRVPIFVDVMDWASLPIEFHQQINRQRILLFPAEAPIEDSLPPLS
ncbi:MAG: nucleotidyltransferase family protein [Vampirovibrionales bacterium]